MTQRDWQKDKALLQLCQSTSTDENEKHALSIGLHWLQEAKELQKIASGRGEAYLKVRELLQAAVERERQLVEAIEQMIPEMLPIERVQFKKLLSTLYPDTPAPKEGE